MTEHVLASGKIVRTEGDTVTVLDPERGEVTLRIGQRWTTRVQVVARLEEATASPEPIRNDKVAGSADEDYSKGAHHALRSMLEMLDAWIQGQQENHQGSDHRYEDRGEECWRQYAPSDIRRMVSDTAREMGLNTEFPRPEVPQEDKPL